VLDEDEVRKIKKCFIASPSTDKFTDIRKLKKYGKRFLWMLVNDSWGQPASFNANDYYIYDQNSKGNRESWRLALNFSGTTQQKTVFESLLTIDASQDQDMTDNAVKKLGDLCADYKIDKKVHTILNAWRKAIEEENLLIFTQNTLIEAESKNWSTDKYDRFITIAKPLLTLFSSICVIILISELTPTAPTIENAGLASWTNSSLDVLNGIVSNVSMAVSFQSENETLFNITALSYKTKQPSPLSPTIIPLAIITFISVVTNFFFDGLNSLFHAFAYLFNPNLEMIQKTMAQKLYEKSQAIQDTEHRKSYIKAMSTVIADTFKKCWHYASAQKKCETMMQEKVKHYA
jgi:hypothetical protein